MSRCTVAGLLLAVILATPAAAHAQPAAPQPQPGILVGQLQVTGPSWSFSGTLPGLSGPFSNATITNTNCTRPFLPGTAQAGAVIFTAVLAPFVERATPLQPFRGSAATGQIQLTPMADSGGTAVSATVTGLEPFVQGTMLSVCLTASPLPPLLADISVGEQRVAASSFDVTGVATATSDTSQPLIGISGTQPSPDGGVTRTWVFFFVGDTYLGTDTLDPSLAPLQLVGSAGPNQLDVRYEDPAGAPSVTITYTLDDDVLSASATPPGHNP